LNSVQKCVPTENRARDLVGATQALYHRNKCPFARILRISLCVGFCLNLVEFTEIRQDHPLQIFICHTKTLVRRLAESSQAPTHGPPSITVESSRLPRNGIPKFSNPISDVVFS
jgi:hypothetical protein